MVHKKLPFQEFEKAFKTLKRKKATGCNGLNGNILRLCKVHYVQNFKGTLEERIFPEKLKISKVISVFKKMEH